jgi:tetratricopeptide (TPR) repeat protein
MMDSTTDSHPREELELFAAGAASSEERQRVVRHLLRGCSSCAGELRRLLMPETDLEALSAVVDRVIARSHGLLPLVDERRIRILDQLDRVERMAPPEQERWLDGLGAAERRIACEILVSRCRDARRQNASLNLRLAELAVRAAKDLDDADRFELGAAAWIQLANARRDPGDFAGAEKALARAQELAERRGPAPRLEADLQLSLAALAHDRRQYDQALAHYKTARAIFRELGDELGEVRALVGMGPVQSQRTEPQDGIPYLEEALRLLEGRHHRDLRRIALHNLAYLHVDGGDPETASRYVDEAAPLFDAGAPRLDRLRFEWNLGRLQRDLGRLEEAAESLEQTRQSYIDEDLPYEVGLVALDLAVVYVRLGRRDELRRLAGETVEIFRTLGIAQESIMALNLLAQAEAAEAYEIVAQVGKVLERLHPRRGSITGGD